MLKLGRKVGERTRIQCPNGELIWVTQCEGFCTVERKGHETLEADYDNSAWIDIGNDTIEIQYNPWMEKLAGVKIGIDAPPDYKILREELLEEGERYGK
jgi:hypothetical protein